MLVNGSAVSFEGNSTLALSGGQVRMLGGENFEVTYNTGQIVQVSSAGSFLNVQVVLPSNFPSGTLTGLLGNDTAASANDLVLADGTVLSQPVSATELYGQYANSWRVTAATSLFDYGPGQSTATFTDTNFPEDELAVTLAQFPASLVAEATLLIQQAGITDPALIQFAILDYLVTGSLDFVTGAQSLQELGGVATTTATPNYLQITPQSIPTVYGVSAAATKVVEATTGATAVTFEVFRTGDLSASETIDYAVTSPEAGYLDASAFAGTLPTGRVTLAAGAASQTFAVDLPAGIGSSPDAILQVQISSPDSIAIGASMASTTVVNNQPTAGPPPVLSLEEISGGGTLTQTGNTWALALNIAQGSDPAPVEFAIWNAAASPADNLSGTISATPDLGLISVLSSAFVNLAPSQIDDFLTLGPNTGTPGTYSKTLTLVAYDVNASNYAATLPTQTLTITSTVFGLAQVAINSPTVINFGTVRSGASATQTVSIENTATLPAEALDASVLAMTGGATASGSVTLLAAGQTDATDISVGLNSTTGGSIDGMVTIGFESDGSNTDGSGTTTLLPQSIQVEGTLYREAAASVVLANPIVHVGDPTADSLSVMNTDPSDGYSENLIASLIGATGQFTSNATGPTGEIAAETSDSTSSGVSFSTAQAGTVSGSVTLALTSDGGTGPGSIDGFGEISLAPRTFAVSATVDNYATAQVVVVSGAADLVQAGTNYTLNLGQMRVGSAPASVQLGVENVASVVADLLEGSFTSSGTSPISLSGFSAFSGVTAGSAQDGLDVMLNTGTAGSFAQQVTLDPTGYNASGYSGALAPEAITITGTVFGAAVGELNSPGPLTVANQRVNAVPLDDALSLTNIASSPAEDLDVSIAGTTGAATASGTITLLGVNAIDATDIGVGVSTGAAGTQTGTVTLNEYTDGTGTDGAGMSLIGTADVQVSGKVYREAQAGVALTNAIFHVGGTGLDTLTVTDTDPTDGYSENLIAALTGATGPFTANMTGPTGDIAAGGSNSNSLGVSFSTAQAGTVSGSVTLALTSDGGTGTESIDGLGQVTLAPQTFNVSATINNYATAQLVNLGGASAFSGNGDSYTLNLGDVALGSTPVAVELGVKNAALSIADLLEGSFTSIGDEAIALGGFSNFAGLAAQQTQPRLDVTLNTNTAGAFTQEVTLAPTDYNSDGFTEALSPLTLTITGTVACFAAGTLIQTTRGMVTVEALSVGERVVLADGGPSEPIVWIGSRAVNCERHPKPETVWPVRIRAGAFGSERPTRDLLLSPEHAVFVNGVLVPVKLLVNGTSITQVRRPTVTYYHVELPRHAVILAEALPVESYLDVGDRANFHQDGDTIRLFPDFAARLAPETAMMWETRGAAPLVMTGPELIAAQQQVGGLAKKTAGVRTVA